MPACPVTLGGACNHPAGPCSYDVPCATVAAIHASVLAVKLALEEATRTVHRNETCKGIGELTLGLWLIVSPFALSFPPDAMATPHNIIMGTAVGVVGGAQLGLTAKPPWLGWLSTFFGFWIVLSPILLAFSSMIALWNNLLTGGAIIALAWQSAAAGDLPLGKEPA